MLSVVNNRQLNVRGEDRQLETYASEFVQTCGRYSFLSIYAQKLELLEGLGR
jgi:hypothetical protein